MVEIWKNIKGFPLYQVSNLGSVRRINGTVAYKNGVVATYRERILKPEKVKGYLRCTLSIQNKTYRFLIHRLVAQYFIPKQHGKICVNHLDGDKTNNRVDNLEWCTYSENEQHSYNVLGKINHNRKLTEDEIIDIRLNAIKASYGGAKDGNIKEYAKKYHVNIKTIHNILNKQYYV